MTQVTLTLRACMICGGDKYQDSRIDGQFLLRGLCDICKHFVHPQCGVFFEEHTIRGARVCYVCSNCLTTLQD